IKKELILIEEETCCLKAELAAIIRMNGVLSSIAPHTMLDIQTESAAIARRIFTILKRVFSGPVELLVRKKMKLKKNNIYIVRIKHVVEVLLDTLVIDYEKDRFETTELQNVLPNNCCRRAYLRGAFIARGSINNSETAS